MKYTSSVAREKVPVAILGSGNIGTDLLHKIEKSDHLFVKYFVGRNEDSPGLREASNLGVETSNKGFDFLVENNDYDVVFDATSAVSHTIHAPILEKMNKKVIDMTPAKIGKLCIPSINSINISTENNINMVTCGGQASIPIVYAVFQSVSTIEYIEIVTSISSLSAGIATRKNIDEYLRTTESAIKEFTGCEDSKVILNLNPAEPCVDMQTTIYCSTLSPDMALVNKNVEQMVFQMKQYVPGYEIVMSPVYQNSYIAIGIRVKGAGDFLPSFAGNLDIINCAAVHMAENMVSSNVDVAVGEV